MGLWGRATPTQIFAVWLVQLPLQRQQNSKGDKIGHSPGTSSYGATRIDESKGEPWFCSEAVATAAGSGEPRG